MDAIEELAQLSDAMRQASALLADEDVDETTSSSFRRPSTFLNVVALGNTVQNLLQQMQARFQSMFENIVSKIDEMGNRINELEKSINDLRAEMGVEGGSPSPLASSQKPEELKPEENSTA